MMLTASRSEKTRQLVTRSMVDGSVDLISLSRAFKTDIAVYKAGALEKSQSHTALNVQKTIIVVS